MMHASSDAASNDEPPQTRRGAAQIEMSSLLGVHEQHGDIGEADHESGEAGAGERSTREDGGAGSGSGVVRPNHRVRSSPSAWAYMCKPQGCGAAVVPPPFLGVEEAIPWGLAAINGFQHAIAMVGTIITAPLVLGGPYGLRLPEEQVQYLIAAGLVVSGLCSFVQVRRLRLGRSGYVLGTGLISVVGTSLTFLPVALAMAALLLQEDSTQPCQADVDCSPAWAGVSGALRGQSIPGVTNEGQCNLDSNRCRRAGPEAYGAILGTCLLTAPLELLLALLPRAFLRRAFPSTVTGVCVTLIGIGLMGPGVKYWGGGVACADAADKRLRVLTGPTLPGNRTASYPVTSPCFPDRCHPKSGALRGVCRYTAPRFDSAKDETLGEITECETFAHSPGVAPFWGSPERSAVLCQFAPHAKPLPFGSAPALFIGASVLFALVAVEMFGSPLLRNLQVVVGLIGGSIVAAALPAEAPDGVEGPGSYMTFDKVSSAPAFTYLWRYPYPLSVYAPAILPLAICFIITTVETVGDVVASAEASRVESTGPELDARIQGGLLADGLNSMLSCLATSLPNTTISQNNGIISLTRCASRRAGYCACAVLLLMGLASKLSAAVASIPDPVLGGLLVFCFANILLSGVHILGSGEASRRQRFVSAFALGIGVSVALVPSVVTNTLLSDPPDETPPGGVGESSAERILSVSMQMFFSTPYCVGTAVAMLLHALLPSEAPDAESRTPSATGATGSAEHFDHQSQFDHHSGGDSVGPSAGERERDSAEPVAHEPQLGGQPRGGSVGPAAEGRDKDASGGVDHQPLMVKIDGQTLLDGQIAVEGPKKRLPSGGDRGARAIPPVDASGNDGQISRNDGQTARNDGQNDARGPPKISGDHQADWW